MKKSQIRATILSAIFCILVYYTIVFPFGIHLLLLLFNVLYTLREKKKKYYYESNAFFVSYVIWNLIFILVYQKTAFVLNENFYVSIFIFIANILFVLIEWKQVECDNAYFTFHKNSHRIYQLISQKQLRSLIYVRIFNVSFYFFFIFKLDNKPLIYANAILFVLPLLQLQAMILYKKIITVKSGSFAKK